MATATNNPSRGKAQDSFEQRVRAELGRRGIKIVDLATRLGLHRNTVSMAIRLGCHDRTRRRIARLLKIPAPAK